MRKIAALFAALMAYTALAIGAVNINSATREQLETLDGIGPVKAQAIIDYRNKNGRFKSLEDIKNVDGIGDATFQKIRKDISLTGTTTTSEKVAQKAPDDAKLKAEAKKAEADAKKDAARAKSEAKRDEAKEKKATERAKSDAKKPDAKKDEEKDKKK